MDQPIDPKSVDIVIYHGSCPDGITGAWPFWRENHDRIERGLVTFIGCTHGQTPPDSIDGKNVIIIDFCFPRSVLISMSKVAKSILVLDHHISAQRDLDGLTEVYQIFDMNRSGAQLAWDYVYPGTERPWFVEVVADRDLWKWEYPYSRPICKYLFYAGYYAWDKLEELQSLTPAPTIRTMTRRGQKILDREEREIATICSRAVVTEFTVPSGAKYRVKLATCTSPTLRSDVGNRLAMDGCDFSATWQYDFLLDEWWISLRTASSDIDLSKICSQFVRGGGHKKAAGFAIFGSKGEKLQTYFRILEVPKNRSGDADLITTF